MWNRRLYNLRHQCGRLGHLSIRHRTTTSRHAEQPEDGRPAAELDPAWHTEIDSHRSGQTEASGATPMKAAVLDEYGVLGMEDLKMPKAGPGEVRIRVAYCGVCHSDLHVINGHGSFPKPCVIGHEISGTIDALGEGVRGLTVAQAVVCSFIMPCGSCRACISGQDELCIPFLVENRQQGRLYDGNTRFFRQDGTPVAMYSMGGLSEYCVVPSTDVFALPYDLDLKTAAIVGCSTFTAFGAVRNVADVGIGTSAAVVGAGGVGSSLVQLCRMAGAGPIIAVDIDESKRENVLSLGATRFVNSHNESLIDAVADATNGVMVDVAFEALGSPETITTAVSLLREGGRAVIVGLPGDTKGVLLDIGTLVRRRLTVAGSYGAHTRSDMPKLIAAVADGRLQSGAVISKEFPFDRVIDAYSDLAGGRIVGRAVVAVGGTAT